MDSRVEAIVARAERGEITPKESSVAILKLQCEDHGLSLPKAGEQLYIIGGQYYILPELKIVDGKIKFPEPCFKNRN